MYRLFINEEEAELNPKSKVKLNRLIFDIEDLSNRGVRFTNAFTLPPTSKNMRLCGSPQLLASNNNALETSQRYTLENNTGAISQGRVIIKEYDQKKGIKIQLSEGVDFWSIAESRQLNDLVIHGDDFQFNDANMDDLKVRSSSVFVTALHDARGDKTNTALSTYQYTRPMYVYRNVLDSIANDLGYTVDYGDVLTDTKINFSGMMSNTRDFFVTDFKYRFQNIGVFGSIDLTTGSELVNLGNNVTGTVNLTNTKYKTGFVIKGNVTSSFDTSITFTFSDRTERVIVPKGSSFINFKTDSSEIGTLLTISAPEPVTFDDVYICSIVSESDIFDTLGAVDLDGMTVLADYNLPVMTFKAFIKIALKQFFLNIDVDNLNKVVRLSRLGDAINTNNFIDLTGRVQRNNKWTSGKAYGKLNAMGYANDNDVDANIGRVYFSVANENAQATKAFIQIDEFSASNEVNVSSERVVQVPIYDTVEAKRQSVSDRIVYFNDVGAFGINATFNELSFQRFYSDHYLPFIENTKRERLLRLEAFINYSEFVKLQGNPLIYVGDLESYFLVTDIGDYENDSLTNLDTIKYG